MPLLTEVPGSSPEAPGTLSFYKQGSSPTSGFTATTEGAVTAPGGITGPVNATTVTLTGATAATVVETFKVTGDAGARLAVTADGTLKWGDGTLAADCQLDRYAAGGLELNCALRFTNGQLLFGPAGDVDLYWGGTGLLKTDNSLVVGAGVQLSAAAAATTVLSDKVTGDAANRFIIGADGKHSWGDGTNPADTVLARTGAAAASLTGSLATSGDVTVSGTTGLTLATAGAVLRVKQGGANATSGTGTLNGTTAVTVTTTKVTANSMIMLSIQAPGGTPSGSIYVFTRTAGTSFQVKSAASDTSTFAWMIVEPSP